MRYLQRNLFARALCLLIALQTFTLFLVLPHPRTTTFLSPPRVLIEDVRPSEEEMKEFEAKLPLIHDNHRRRNCHPDKRCLVHLHIGKNGGTSIDSIARKLRSEFIGGRHFDWSYIQGAIGLENADVVLMLRDPVARSLSHFYFTQQVYGSPKMKATNLSSFLSDPLFLMEERGIWQDGMVPLRDELGVPSRPLLHLAADRLEQTLWFGILEDVPRSMELLQHIMKLNYRPELPQRNKGSNKTASIPLTSQQRVQLEYLTPMDRWLYSYGLALFEARWDAYQRNSSVVDLPPRPPYPEIPCWSTRFELHCKKGPLKGNFTWVPPRPKKPEAHQQRTVMSRKHGHSVGRKKKRYESSV